MKNFNIVVMIKMAMDDHEVDQEFWSAAAATPMSDRLTSQQIILLKLMKMLMKMVMMMMMLNCLQVSDYKQVVFYEVATP